MTVTARITRNRKARGVSSWSFVVNDPATIIEGEVRGQVGDADIDFERAGWRAVEIVQAIVAELTDLPVAVTFEGLEPHPAGQKPVDPPKLTSGISTPTVKDEAKP